VLAKHVRMSPSAFHLHFKGVTTMIRFNTRATALQEARRLMLGKGATLRGRVPRRVRSPSHSAANIDDVRSPPRRDVAALKVEARPNYSAFTSRCADRFLFAATAGRFPPRPPRNC